MTRKEIDELLKTNENGEFINLIIPKDELGEELNLIGKNTVNLSLEEAIRVKQYANHLYANAK